MAHFMCHGFFGVGGGGNAGFGSGLGLGGGIGNIIVLYFANTIH